jgi:hypothetical protein
VLRTARPLFLVALAACSLLLVPASAAADDLVETCFHDRPCNR